MPGIAINGELCDSEGLFLQQLMSSLPFFQQQLKNRAQTPKEKLAGDWKAIPRRQKRCMATAPLSHPKLPSQSHWYSCPV